MSFEKQMGSWAKFIAGIERAVLRSLSFDQPNHIAA
jgi:hypothetical protein